VEGEVPDDDGQHNEATGNPTRPGQEPLDAEECEGETNQRSQVQDAADEPEAATDTGDRKDGDGELLESETTLQRHSKDGSTEPPANCSHTPPPGILLCWPRLAVTASSGKRNNVMVWRPPSVRLSVPFF